MRIGANNCFLKVGVRCASSRVTKGDVSFCTDMHRTESAITTPPSTDCVEPLTSRAKRVRYDIYTLKGEF